MQKELATATTWYALGCKLADGFLDAQTPRVYCLYSFAAQYIRSGILQVFSTYRFKFDHVHDPGSEQGEVYDVSAKETVANAIQVRLLTWTSSYSTHTMLASPL